MNNHHWVFITAGTNVGLVTTVTDTKTGAVKTYSNPDLTVAAPIQDTDRLGPSISRPLRTGWEEYPANRESGDESPSNRPWPIHSGLGTLDQ